MRLIDSYVMMDSLRVMDMEATAAAASFLHVLPPYEDSSYICS